MNKESIIKQLMVSYASFNSTISSLSEEDFQFTIQDKWNAGQTLDHMYRAVNALSLGLMLPKQVIGLNFGKTSRLSKDYAALISQYIELLKKGGKASGRFLPGSVTFSRRKSKVSALQRAVGKICKRLHSYSEEELDQYLLPHPLLGKITLREMLYFTIYHAEHHEVILKRGLEHQR